MILMSRPWCHPKTGVWYFRCRMPSELAHIDAGAKVSVDVAGTTTTIKLGPILKVSLRTRDTGEARLRHASVQQQFERRWSGMRSGAAELPHRDIIALAGWWYRDLVTNFEADPGDTEGWEAYQDDLTEVRELLDPDSDGIERPAYNPDRAMVILSRHIDLEDFLARRGLQVDKPTRIKLSREVARALCEAIETLKRRSSGDYGPDRLVRRFPPLSLKLNDAPTVGAAEPGLGDVFEGWARETEPKRATRDLWRSYLTSFITFIGHDRAQDVSRRDINAWKQHLLGLGNSRKTINDSKLAALKAIFAWAADNDMLSANPASGVSLKRDKKAGERMLGFEKAEAATILKAAAEEASPAYRWIPLLCAQSGARVAEICQLRAEDICLAGC